MLKKQTVFGKKFTSIAVLGAMQCVVMMYRQILEQLFAQSFCSLKPKDHYFPLCIQMCSFLKFFFPREKN